MYYKEEECGGYAVARSGDTIYLHFVFAKDRDEEARSHCIAYIVNRMIVRYRPKQFIVTKADPKTIQALYANLFFDKGKNYVRPVEKMRYVLVDRVFDEEGYIVDQGAMRVMPFGWFDTAAKGCGWIAAYNFMKAFGQEAFMQETATEIASYSSFGNVMGVSIFALLKYFKKHGIAMHMYTGSNERIAKIIQDSTMGILLYVHTDGAHYCAYEKRPDGRIRFLNAGYGRRNDIMDPARFLRQRTVLQCCKVFVVEEKHRNNIAI